MTGSARQAALLASAHYLPTLADDAPLPSLEAELREVCRKTYRRVDRFIQLALLGAGRCAQNGCLAADCGVYLGSSLGPLHSNMAVQRQMLGDHLLPKPFSFVNTLGNIAGFYINDNLRLATPSVFVSRGGECLQALLATALADLAVGAVSQALVGVVEEVAPTLAEHRQRLGMAAGTPVAEGSHWLLLAPDTPHHDGPVVTQRRYASIDELSACLNAEATATTICLNHVSDRAGAEQALRDHARVVARSQLSLPRHASVEAAWFIGALQGTDAWPTLIDCDARGAGELLALRA